MERMIENATLVLGPPGCGKTHYLLDQIEQALRSGTLPHEIIFVSYTKKAIQEALARACGKFNLQPKDFPFFKTTHALGYAGLGLQRTDVLSSEDYRIIGRDLGLVLESISAVDFDDGQLIPAIIGNGSAYVHLENRARYRCVSLEQEYNDANDYDISYPLLVKVRQVIDLYKQANMKFDFVDMVEKYIDLVPPPRSKLLIVDEAQDLTKLQWNMIGMLAENSERVLIAGDDDQAIYSFAGAEVKNFVSCSSKIHILSQSYRLPETVWELSQRVVKRIQGRIDKEFLPKESKGAVHWHMSYHTIPFDNGGSWTVMFRINAFLKEFAELLENDGYVYSVKGRSSINQGTAAAVYAWRTLQGGGRLYLRQVQDLYKLLTKQGPEAALRRGATTLLGAADPEVSFSMEDLQKSYGLLAGADADAFDVLKMGYQEKMYIAAAERRGVDITAPPKINLSTFHAMKGGEDDNCVVYLGTTRTCAEGDENDEQRALYVAITRAKHTLHLLDSDKRYRILI